MAAEGLDARLADLAWPFADGPEPAAKNSLISDLLADLNAASEWSNHAPAVTLPGLRPTILFTIVVSTIGAAQLFGEPLLYDPSHQPGGGTSNQYQTLGLLMYQQGWTYDHLGLASATAWTMFVIILLAVLLNLTLARRRDRKGLGGSPLTLAETGAKK